MNVGLRLALSDQSLDAHKTSHQRQLAIFVSALAPGQLPPQATSDNDVASNPGVPLNLCLILDHSGSMAGRPMRTVKAAAQSLVDRLSERDRISIIAFDHHAKVLVPNQPVRDPAQIKAQIQQLDAQGGTAIDEGLNLGIAELAVGKTGTVSQVFLLTDGDNEHGNDQRCLDLSTIAIDQNITLNPLGFGSQWNEDLLEQIADTGGGTLSLIEKPENAVASFNQLLTRIESVELTNAHLLLQLEPTVHLAEHKPLAQVAPDTIELPFTQTGPLYQARLGDVMSTIERTVLATLYIDALPSGRHTLGTVQIRYDHPAYHQTEMLSATLPIEVEVTPDYHPHPHPDVQPQILALAKYRQTQLAEAKLQQGDALGAATMLQAAANTALQMGDQGAATVLQTNATQLEAGQDLSERDRKKTRIVSKTILQ